jgi:hypothetical protein
VLYENWMYVRILRYAYPTVLTDDDQSIPPFLLLLFDEVEHQYLVQLSYLI